MPDYKFLKSSSFSSWMILAPRRAKRPDESSSNISSCPFCPGNEAKEKELFRIGGRYPNPDWKVRVLYNKFPFGPYHELIINSVDHHKSFGELPVEQVELVLKTYQNRYQAHQKNGQVYIFANYGA